MVNLSLYMLKRIGSRTMGEKKKLEFELLLGFRVVMAKCLSSVTNSSV